MEFNEFVNEEEFETKLQCKNEENEQRIIKKERKEERNNNRREEWNFSRHVA